MLNTFCQGGRKIFTGVSPPLDTGLFAVLLRNVYILFMLKSSVQALFMVVIGIVRKLVQVTLFHQEQNKKLFSRMNFNKSMKLQCLCISNLLKINAILVSSLSSSIIEYFSVTKFISSFGCLSLKLRRIYFWIFLLQLIVPWIIRVFYINICKLTQCFLYL